MPIRFFLLLLNCFLLTPVSVAYADVVAEGPFDEIFELLPFVLPVAMIIGVIAGTMVLIRFWKRKKGNKVD